MNKLRFLTLPVILAVILSTFSVQAASAAPKNNLTLSQVGDDITMKWSYSKSPKKQTVKIFSTDGVVPQSSIDLSSKVRSFTIKDLTYGAKYNITLSTLSPKVTLKKTITLIPKAPAPAGLSAKWGESGVDVNWQIESGFAKFITKQIISYTPEGGKTTNLDLSAVQRSTILNKLDANKSYTISLKAVTKAGEGKSSAVTLVSVTPKAPIVEATVLSASSIELSWVYIGPQPSSQTIEILPELSASKRASEKINLGSDIRKYVLNDLSPAAQYRFAIFGSNSLGKGLKGFSSTVKIHKTPSTPEKVVAEAGNSSVKLTWMPPAETGGSSILGYKVEYSTNGAKWSSAGALAASPTPTPSANPSPSASPTPNPSAAPVTSTNPNISTTSTTFTVGALVNGSSYQFRVSAVSEAGVGTPSNPVSILAGITPGAPGSLQATAGRKQVSLAWVAPTTAGVTISGYLVEINSGTGWSILANRHSDRTFIASNLLAGTTYQFRISALGSGLTGESSSIISAKPFDLPSPPTGVTVTPSEQRLLIVWNAANDQGSPITSYKIDYLTPTADWANLGSSTTTSFYTPALVTPGTLYRFRVSAVNSAGTGAFSDIVEGRALTTPSAPLLTLTSGASQLLLNWSTPDSSGLAISSYTVQVASAGSTPNWSTINSAVSSNTYTITNLLPGNSYQVRVAARNALGVGAYSTPVTAIVYGLPAAPTGFTLAQASIGSATLSWTAPSGNGSTISDYRISYQVGSGAITNISTGSTTTSYRLNNLTPGVQYTVTVAAINQAGVGTASTPITVTVFSTPLAPQSLSAVGANQSVVLTWTPPVSTGAAENISYCVQWSLDQNAWSACSTTETTSLTASNLTNGNTYYFRVTTRRSGIGDSDPISTSATPIGVPTSPRNFNGVGISNGVVLNWDAPNTDGGLPITSYTIESYSQTIPRNGTTFTWTASVTPNLQYYSIRADGTEVGKVLAGTERYTTTTFDSTKIYTVIPVALVAGSEEDGAAIAYNSYTDGREPLANLGAAVRTFEIGSLVNGTLYTFRLVAKNAFGESQAVIAEVTAGSPASRAPLPKVQSLSATPGDTTVTLNWNSPAGVDILTISGYRIDTRLGSTGSWITVEDLTTQTEYIVDNLSNGTTYSFRVTGINAGGPGESAFISSSPSGDTPSLVTNLTASPRDGSVVLDWADLTLSSYEFELTYEKSDGSTAPTVVSTGNSSAYIVNGLTNGVKYLFSVKAINTGVSPNISGPSRSIEASPYARPGIVQSLVATPRASSVALTWAKPANTGGASTVTYRVEYSRDNVSWSIHEIGITEARIADTITNSERSATAAIFTIGTHSFEVGDLVIVSGSSRGLNFSTLKPITATTATTISVADNTGALASAADTGTISKATLITDLIPGVKYFVRVAAVNPAGIGVYANSSASPTE